MAQESYLERKMRERSHRRWRDETEAVPKMTGARLRRTARDARSLRRLLDGFLEAARPRLARGPVPPRPVDLPLGVDVVWRPDLWSVPIWPTSAVAFGTQTGLGAGVSLHHDCPLREAVLRQIPDQDDKSPAPFLTRIEVMGFQGSFLSLAIALSPEMLAGLRRDHIIRLDVAARSERESRIYARLNIRHGPNTDELLRELPVAAGDSMSVQRVEFDLFKTGINEKRVEAGWLDLIFERPEWNVINIGDVVLARYPRADM